MKITKSQLENIIREELALVKEAGDPVGLSEAQKMAELLQHLGFTLTRGGFNSFIEFLEGLENRGDLNATPHTRRGALAEKSVNEGLYDEGLMEIMVDALRSELATWHPEAKAQAYDELATSGLDLTKAALDILDDDAGRHPGGTIGEDAVAEQGGASVRSFESDVENIVSRAQAAGIPDQDLAEVLQMYAANLGGNF